MLQESKACNRICYNGGNFSSIQTGNMIGHACLCNGKFYGRCCEKPALVLNVNIYMYSITECIVWEPAPVIQRSCGENGALEGETGDTEGENTPDEIQQLYDELLEENELNDLL
uniref:EGF-like domain-containing protein n=1 Tax=Ciona savignyi TaxID=51511 RepID=H2ZFG8_CIOSA